MYVCIDGGDDPCDHVNYVSRFNLIHMVPYRPKDVRNEVEEDNTLINNDHEMLDASLNVGEHFIVIVIEDNFEGDDF